MTRIAVIVGSDLPVPTDIPRLPGSDRGALQLAMARLDGEIDVYGRDGEALCYARAAGAKFVEAFSDMEIRSFDIALIGRGGCGERGDLLPALLAEQHRAALAYDVIDVEMNTDGFLVTRDLGRGARDVLRIRAPMVLLIAETAARGPYISRYRLNAASTEFAEVGTRGEPPLVNWEPTTPRVRLGNYASQVAGPATDRMNALFGLSESNASTATLIRGSGEVCARHLLHYLSRNGFLEPGLGIESEPVANAPERTRPARESPDRAIVSTGQAPARVRRRPRRKNTTRGQERGPRRIGIDLDPESPLEET